MDKKSIIGIGLIFAILVVFSLINQPSKEEIAAAQHRKDSIAQVEAQRAIEQERVAQERLAQQNTALAADTASQSEALQARIDEFGVFGNATAGEETFTTLENNEVKITFSNKGGRIYAVQLKDYQTHDSLPFRPISCFLNRLVDKRILWLTALRLRKAMKEKSR